MSEGFLLSRALPRWSPGAFQRRPAILTRLTGWSWRVQGGVQTQPGNERWFKGFQGPGGGCDAMGFIAAWRMLHWQVL